MVSFKLHAKGGLNMTLLEVDLMRLKGYLSKKQRHAAEAIGMHKNTLYKKLRGETDFTIKELNEIAKYLKQDTMEFLRELEIDDEAA
jgi:predicted DNA-binding protein (UPF0251 family)